MFKPKLPQQEQGFTLVEVLVAILITSLFVAVAMQAMVLAAVFKSRAKQYTEATNWIQQDLETVKNQAAQFPSLTANATANQLQVSVSSVNGFADGDVLKVGTDPDSYTIAPNGVDKTNLKITLTKGLGSVQLKSNLVVDTAWCNTTAQTAGFAYYLRQNLPTSVNTTPSIKIGNIDYNPININPNPKAVVTSKLWLLRNVTVSPNAPYNVLQLNYAVVPDVNGSPGTFPVATLYTEVIPDAALQCP